jgi:hypothetical protein
MKTNQTLKVCLLLALLLYSSYLFAIPVIPVETQTQVFTAKDHNLNAKVLKLALEAYNKARAQGFDSKGVLTIVDYSKPSTQPRFWVLNLKTNEILFHELVAHGKGSGENLATKFSNRSGSAMSSLGLYLTQKPYIGNDGYSLRLIGLEKGFNDLALERNVVIHPASYVSSNFARSYGRLGRSWGCFALNPAVAKPVIKTIKEGTLLFAYYPDPSWLHHSKYLT